jgi:hypothetical protein
MLITNGGIMFIALIIIASINLFLSIIMTLSPVNGWVGVRKGSHEPWGFHALAYEKGYDRSMMMSSNSTISKNIAITRTGFSYFLELFTRIIFIFFVLLIKYRWFYGEINSEKYLKSINYEWIIPVSLVAVLIFHFIFVLSIKNLKYLSSAILYQSLYIISIILMFIWVFTK